MRNTRRAAFAAILLSVVLLAGSCAGRPSGTVTSAPAAPVASGDLSSVKVGGEVGTNATITLPTAPFVLAATEAILLADGTGAELAPGQQMLMQMTAVDENGELVGTTYESTPESIGVGNTSLPELDAVLATAHIGARALVGIVSEGITSVYVMDVVDAYDVLAKAEGTQVDPVDGLPTVSLDATGVPSIVSATDAAPTTLVAQDLITGTGPVVEANQIVMVHYSGWLWDGTPFDSSWGRGEPFAFTVGASQVIPGWDTGLVGKTVGSQVLLVVPPDQGYGDADNGTIPANSTLVFVVDILAAHSMS